MPSNAGDTGLIPGQGTKIPHVSWPKKPEHKQQKQYYNKFNRKKKKWPTYKKKTFKKGKLNEKCSEISSFQTLRKICRAREKVIKASVLTILPTWHL